MYQYKHFIKENVAPKGAKKIGVYDSNGNMVCDIPLGRLKQPDKEKRYSFCALSDVHLTKTYSTAYDDFQRALTYAEKNCDFTCICGDLTSAGSDREMTTYKNIVDTYASTKPVYAILGNHETIYGYRTDEEIKQYTGHGLYYSFTKDDDVFIMIGHYGKDHSKGNGDWRSYEFVSEKELQFLYETLEANRNKRCFIFSHVLPHEHEVGNAKKLYKKPLLFYTEDNGIGQAFISLLRHYKNTVFFHGHSHIRFWLQELDEMANYSDKYGYRSVHIPSISVPKDLSADGKELKEKSDESEGYIVDVYDDCIVLNGRDFIDNDKDGHWLPIATYKIDTRLVQVKANTFKDSTGIIKTEVQ